VAASKRSVLIVDNDPEIHKVLTLLLSPEYDVTAVDSADAAEAVFHRHQSVDIILTDQKMGLPPKRNGIQLLEWVRFHSPRTIRLLMTGFAELEDTIDAINRGHVYHYLSKPWRNDEVLFVLRNAAEKFELVSNRDQLFEQLQQANRDLELRVAQRTEELEKANAELRKAYWELQAHDEEMKRLALTDPLTQLKNRRMIEGLAQAELKRHARYHSPLSLGIIDIDHFKEINTTQGLPGGDAILVGLAKLLTASMRETDTVGRAADEEFLSVGRYGGEEFLVIAREANEEGARILAERIRKKVESTPIEYNKQLVPITVSIGFAVAEGKTPVTYSEMYRVAATALQQAKQEGRNRCKIHPLGS
jgi:diguanylate cyclase (GGDEF)-like protein